MITSYCLLVGDAKWSVWLPFQSNFRAHAAQLRGNHPRRLAHLRKRPGLPHPRGNTEFGAAWKKTSNEGRDYLGQARRPDRPGSDRRNANRGRRRGRSLPHLVPVEPGLRLDAPPDKAGLASRLGNLMKIDLCNKRAASSIRFKAEATGRPPDGRGHCWHLPAIC